jgi:hypothetical protein
MEKISQRLQETLVLLALGYGNTEIATFLAVERATVYTYVSRLREQLEFSKSVSHVRGELEAFQTEAMAQVREAVWDSLEARGVDVKSLRPELRTENAFRTAIQIFRSGQVPPPTIRLANDTSHRVAELLNLTDIERLLRNGPTASLSQDKWLVHLLVTSQHRWKDNERLRGLAGDFASYWMKQSDPFLADASGTVIVEAGEMSGYLGLWDTEQRFMTHHIIHEASESGSAWANSTWLSEYYGSPKKALFTMLKHLHRNDVSDQYRAIEVLLIEPLWKRGIKTAQCQDLLTPEEIEQFLEEIPRIRRSLEGMARLKFREGAVRVERCLMSCMLDDN